MYSSIRSFVLFLTALIFTVSACTTNTEKNPRYYDSDRAGKKAKRAEFPMCKPATETGPILLDGSIPKYPRREYRSGNTGYVAVRFVVTETGTATNVEILSASSLRFAEEVKTAVGKWTFRPAMDQGTPVAVVCAQRHQFHFE